MAVVRTWFRAGAAGRDDDLPGLHPRRLHIDLMPQAQPGSASLGERDQPLLQLRIPEHGHPPHAAATRCSARRARQGPGAVASRRRSGIRSATSARTRYAFDIFTADGDLTAGLSGGDHAAFTLSTQRLKPAMKPTQRRRGCAVRAAPGRQQPPIRGDCRRDRRRRRHPASARSGPPAPPDTADPLRSGRSAEITPAPQGSVATIRPLPRDRRHDPHGSHLGSRRRRPRPDETNRSSPDRRGLIPGGVGSSGPPSTLRRPVSRYEQGREPAEDRKATDDGEGSEVLAAAGYSPGDQRARYRHTERGAQVGDAS